MKTTTLSSKCFLGSRALPYGAIQRGGDLAHTPGRRQTGPARGFGRAPRVSVFGQHLGYVEVQQGQQGSCLDTQRMPLGMRHVLHVDTDPESSALLAGLLMPQVRVTHVSSLVEARRMLAFNVFSMVIIDPAMPEGDARVLLPLLTNTPVLVYSAYQPEWRDIKVAFLPKPCTTSRQLWLAVSSMLGLPASLVAGD